jgi:oxygen-independent coproporphyrinogen-3 oxidase
LTGLYVHVPFCARKCLYCDFYSLPDKDFAFDTYVDAVLSEAEDYTHLVFDTVFFGGGTPSLLGAELFAKLHLGLKEKLNIQSVETTVEVNPESATPIFFKTCKETGVSRISIGVQSLDENQLQAVGRIHNRKQALLAIESAFGLGFDSVSVDVMIGLPGQNWNNLKKTLEALTPFDITHISAYGLQLEHDTPLGQNPPKNTPDDDHQVELLEKTREYLIQKGFVHYEISNFAKPGFECRHNLKYWRCQDYAGLGPGASSHIESVRYKNKNDLDSYIANFAGIRNFEECETGLKKAREKAMLGLRLLEEGINLDQDMLFLKSEFDEMVTDGDLDFNGTRYKIPPSKMFLSNKIFAKVLGL